MAPPEAAPQPNKYIPPQPRTVEETGLGMGALVDLALKIMYFEGYISGYELADRIKLPYSGIVDQIVEFFKREKLCEVKGAGGFSESAYQYAISEKGRALAREALDRSEYAGPAPVPLSCYSNAIRSQPLGDIVIHQRKMRQALSHLVISEKTFGQVGPAVNSGRSIFLFGHPGNGKTAIAEAIGDMILGGGSIFIPYAMEVHGQVVRIFDPVIHVPSDEPLPRNVDPRFVLVKRPVVITGGELTLPMLDLVYDPTNKYYEAPFQIKANGGLLLIDDFGRQQARPRDLLNRWIVPLEKRIDYLTLHTGSKIEVPFDVLIVFSTNLAPKDLVDEAFLRRIRHKIEVEDPTYEEFREIFRRVCEGKGVPYDERGLAYLMQEYYMKPKRPLRACHPRDIVEEIRDIARYLNTPVVLSKELLDLACSAYFVDL